MKNKNNNSIKNLHDIVHILDGRQHQHQHWTLQALQAIGEVEPFKLLLCSRWLADLQQKFKGFANVDEILHRIARAERAPLQQGANFGIEVLLKRFFSDKNK